MSLALLIDDPETVLAQWPTEPVLSKRDPVTFADLLTLAEVDAWIDTGCLAMRNVSLLADGIPVDPRVYEGENGMPKDGYLRRHLDQGGTLSVRSLERLKPSVATLYNLLQDELGYSIHVNAYLTPADCQGLHYHYDPYVTAILQVHGCKEWPVHAPFVKDPLRGWGGFKERRFTSEEMRYLANTPPNMTYTLTPGDAFWLPRGFVHAPYTVGKEPSLHLTVAVKERTRHWLLEQIFEQVAHDGLPDPAMREAVPPADVSTEARIDEARRYAIGALMTLDVARAARAIREAAHPTPLV